MTRSDYTAIALLIDRSGSMTAIRKVTQSAINEFIHGQAASEGKRTIHISHFDMEYETVMPTRAAADAPEYELHPRGTTALYDSMVRIIDDFGGELREMPEQERPANVLVAIMTDGLENASMTSTAKDVSAKVKHQEEHYNWRFLFMGANQDAVLTGEKLGMPASSSISYSASPQGVRNVTTTLADYTRSVAAGAAPAITEEEREKAMEK